MDMHADLTPDNAAFLENQVATGAFASGGDALNAAVRLLRFRAEVLEKVDRSQKELDAGDYNDLDEEGMDRYFGELFSIAAAAGKSA